MKIISISLLIVLFTSCATEFTGDAHITKDECIKKCENWGLKMSGMVALGEYSSACICSKKDSNKSASCSMNKESLASVSAGVAGVITQQENIETINSNNLLIMSQ